MPLMGGDIFVSLRPSLARAILVGRRSSPATAEGFRVTVRSPV
jgi:hypothetical protein